MQFSCFKISIVAMYKSIQNKKKPFNKRAKLNVGLVLQYALPIIQQPIDNVNYQNIKMRIRML